MRPGAAEKTLGILEIAGPGASDAFVCWVYVYVYGAHT